MHPSLQRSKMEQKMNWELFCEKRKTRKKNKKERKKNLINREPARVCK